MLGMFLISRHMPCKSAGSESWRSPTEPGRLPWGTCEQKKVKVASWQDCLRWLVPIGAVAVRSHSRPEEANFSIRARMLNRPAQQFCSTTGRSKKDANLYYVLTPTSPRNERALGRNAETAPVRARLKQARSSSSLQSMFEDARDHKQVDASVIGSAMQLCGQRVWWETLLWFYHQKQQLGIAFFCIEQSICLNALACCLKCDLKKVSSQQVLERKGSALELAKDVFQEYEPQTSEEFNCILSTCLKLCRLVGTDAAIAWSQELIDWAKNQPFAKTIVSHATVLMILEKQKRCSEVDDILMNVLGNEGLQPNEVVLGGLLDCAAHERNWKRADRLWDMLVHKLAVQPNSLTYNAYAKVHFCAGRPETAVAILDEMFEASVGQVNYRLAVNYLQYASVLCFGAPSSANRLRLSEHIARWNATIAKEANALRQARLEAAEICCAEDAEGS